MVAARFLERKRAHLVAASSGTRSRASSTAPSWRTVRAERRPRSTTCASRERGGEDRGLCRDVKMRGPMGRRTRRRPLARSLLTGRVQRHATLGHHPPAFEPNAERARTTSSAPSAGTQDPIGRLEGPHAASIESSMGSPGPAARLADRREVERHRPARARGDHRQGDAVVTSVRPGAYAGSRRRGRVLPRLDIEVPFDLRRCKGALKCPKALP